MSGGGATPSSVNFAGGGVYDDFISISLTAGDWDVTAIVYFGGSGAAWSQIKLGISTTSGNSAAGLNIGDNFCQAVWAESTTVPSQMTLTIPSYRMSLSGTTTVYCKTMVANSSGTAAGYGRISARRVR